MRIRRYVLIVAFYDEATEREFSEQAIENVIDHGMLEKQGASTVRFIDERHVDYPDIDWSLPSSELGIATEAWDWKAEDEIRYEKMANPNMRIERV